MSENRIFRNLNFAKEIYIQAFKQLKEYPVNFWSLLYFDIIISVVYLFFYVIMQDITFIFLNWTYFDFIVFYLSISLITKATYFFQIRAFNLKLLGGDLNVWRTKPINTFLATSLQNKDSGIYTTFIFVPIILFFILWGDFQNYLLAFFILLFSLLYYIVFLDFFESIAFIIKENNFLIRMSKDIHYLNEKYTPKVFENSFLFFLYFLPTALFGYFFIEVLNGRTGDFFNYFIGILTTFLFFILGLYLLWKYGLKRYEAFG